MSRWRRFAVLPLLAALLATAQPASAESVIVRAGRLLDIEQGRYLENQAIRIDNGRVVAIAPYAAKAVDNAQVIDWSAFTVLPGLIDLHTHLVGDISSSNIAAPLMSSEARDTLLGVVHARATLAAGFTTAGSVDVSASDDAIRYAEILDELEAARLDECEHALRDGLVVERVLDGDCDSGTSRNQKVTDARWGSDSDRSRRGRGQGSDLRHDGGDRHRAPPVGLGRALRLLLLPALQGAVRRRSPEVRRRPLRHVAPAAR